jgi:hypothetical protein
MNTSMKRALTAGLVLLGLGVITQKAQAASTDTIQLSVTPGNITYGVSISSPYASGYNFGSVNLGQTTVSTLAITVTATGANSAEFFGLAVANTSGGWAPASAPASDAFRMVGYFNATQPSSTTFNAGSDFLTNTVGAASGHYNESAKTAPAGSASLWLRLDMPTALNAGGTGSQTMVLTVTGQPN